MVLSLFNICRIEIRNQLENGRPLKVHLLSPILRQSILDVVLMRGTITEPACLSILSSKEFLDGLSSLNMQCGIVSDYKYLDLVTKSMAEISPSGKTFGYNISELHLNLYTNYKDYALNLRSIVFLIAQCSRLAKLDLHIVPDYKNKPDVSGGGRKISLGGPKPGDERPALLNALQEFKPCLSVLENLIEFSFDGVGYNVLILEADHPILEFKQLASLTLKNCSLDGAAWHEFLYQIRETLTLLHVKSVQVLGKDRYTRCCLLPYSMPNLKSLQVDDEWLVYSRLFVKNLALCSKLENIHLHIDGGEEMEKSDLLELAKLNVVTEIDLVLRHQHHGDAIFENSSEIKFVGSVNEKMKHFRLSCTTQWNERFSSALKQVVDKCYNLTNFHFLPWFSSEELRLTKLSLIPIFANQQRAWNLRELKLEGEYDDSVLKPIFENCVNLDWIMVIDCPQLRDDHLMELARRGVRLSKFSIVGCINVTDNGLIPILINSGDKLKRFDVDSPGITDRTYRVLIELCRFVNWERLPSDDLKQLARSKCFRALNEPNIVFAYE